MNPMQLLEKIQQQPCRDEALLPAETTMHEKKGSIESFRSHEKEPLTGNDTDNKVDHELSSGNVASRWMFPLWKIALACMILCSTWMRMINQPHRSVVDMAHHQSNRRLMEVSKSLGTDGNPADTTTATTSTASVPFFMAPLFADLQARKKLFDDAPPNEIKYWFEYAGPLQVRTSMML
jgi:hypothetical protein